MPSPPSDKNLVWVDLEMTGLDPDRHAIVEIATLVTDGELNVLAEGPVLAIHQPEDVIAGMDAWGAEHPGQEVVKRWYPNGPHLPEKKNAHLALDDIKESIEELRFYRKHFFLPR